MAEDGVVVDLVDGVARIVGVVPCGYVYVDGLSVGDITESSLKDRRILGDEGFVSVFVVVDSQTGKIVGGPEIQARGSGIEDAAFDEVVERIQQVLNDMAAEGSLDLHQIQQRVRRTVGRWVNDRYRRRPMIVPVVVEV
jgi:ribonuclease J